MSDFYDINGKTISMEEWCELFKQPGYKIIEQTEIAPDVLVSTVWLGSNHRFGPGPPLIFETLVFGGDHDGDMDRYSTLPEAIEGHARICADARIPKNNTEKK